MNTSKTRPLSPHLQVYRLPMTALMSISHRITGAILAGGLFLVVAMLVAAAMGEGPYNTVMVFAQSPLGAFVLLAWAATLYYHTLNGIRHLIWDMNPALVSKTIADISSWFILAGTALLTVATWYFAQ